MLNRFQVSRTLATLTGLLMGLPAMAATDNWQLNMYKGVTPISRDMYDLHMIAMLICAIIGVGVFGVMIYSLIYHRKSKGHQPATFHDHPRLEIVWSVIPFLILVGLAVPATRVLMNMDNTDDSDVTIKIIGSQWKWQYQYLDQGISYFSNLSTPFSQIMNEEKKGQWYLLEVDKPLVVPVNKKIRFLVTSTDVIHSWWVPELGVKRDAIPGFMHEAWASIEKPGVYRGQCTELCGINHGFMPIVVQAVSDEEFNTWVAQQTKAIDQYDINRDDAQEQKTLTKDELMTLGKTKYDQVCSACHQVNGKGLPPMYPPLKGSSVAVGKPISRHVEMILHGVPGTAMQAYKDQFTDEELAAITTYERNAWENNTGDLVQPADVAKIRQGDVQEPKMVKKAQAGGLQ